MKLEQCILHTVAAAGHAIVLTETWV